MDILTTVRTALEIAERTKNLDLKKAILDLQEEVQNQRGENLRLREENAALKEKAKVQAAQKGEGDRMKVIAEVGWLFPETPGGEMKGPFCPPCYEDMGKKYGLVKRWAGVTTSEGSAGSDYFECPRCKTTFPYSEPPKVSATPTA